jgi:hypothetical protein
MAARTRRWVSEVAGIPSLAKMCLICFSAAPRVIQRVFAMPAFDCPLGHEREHLAFSWRERVEGVCPPSGREQFDDELGVEDGAAFADARERVDEFIQVGY